MFLIYPVAFLIVLFLVLYLFVIQPFVIMGNSMLPTYPNKTYVIADKISYKLYKPQKGDIVIYRPPDGDVDYIARVIGIPDERIGIENNNIQINERVLQEDYLSEGVKTRGGDFIKEGQIYTVPQMQFFILGDNREYSTDSRKFGFVPLENIKGKVRFCYANCPK